MARSGPFCARDVADAWPRLIESDFSKTLSDVVSTARILSLSMKYVGDPAEPSKVADEPEMKTFSPEAE